MITEEEIEERLKELNGKVPNVLIDDLRRKLRAKKDILTPEQVERIISKVRDTYTGQVEKLERLSKRVDEIGKHIDEIRQMLLGKNSGTIIQEPEEEKIRASTAGPEPEVKGGREMITRDDIGGILFEPGRGRFRLEKIPDDVVSTMLAFKWLGFLMDRVGRQNLDRVLEFYYEIGWISDEVMNTLLKYAEGVKPHPREPEWKPEEKLTIRDHLISLLFIERLRGTKVSRDIIDQVDREVKTIERMLEEIYGV